MSASVHAIRFVELIAQEVSDSLRNDMNKISYKLQDIAAKLSHVVDNYSH